MRVTMFFHGGSSYAPFDTLDPRDAEEFATLAAAKSAFESRADRSDPYYPCVESPAAWICKGPAARNIGAEYPDLILTLGPRGAVRCERA